MECAIKLDFKTLHKEFNHPVTLLDCGSKCAPYNQYGRPFCCDNTHCVPTAYQAEWLYLQTNTNLWHLWKGQDGIITNQLRMQTPPGQVLIECLGHRLCQRAYRSITCRSFPFYPYISNQDEFIGLAYYWQFEDRCWVISNLHFVSAQFRIEFYKSYRTIFIHYPSEWQEFRHQSVVHRQVFGKRHKPIPLLHENGHDYLVNPKNGYLLQVDTQTLPKHGPYEVASMMLFPDEKWQDQ